MSNLVKRRSGGDTIAALKGCDREEGVGLLPKGPEGRRRRNWWMIIKEREPT